MKNLTSVLLFALFITLNTSCGSNNSKATPVIEEAGEDVAVKKFANLIEEGHRVLIDVRTPNEFAKGHIKGAKMINFMAPNFEEKMNQLDKKNTSYLVYCAVGGRSRGAMKKMKAAGFKSVYNLAGGVNAWSVEGMTLEQ